MPIRSVQEGSVQEGSVQEAEAHARHGRTATAEPEPRERLTIEQLAQETGMTVRNIRAHHSRRLLPPPELREGTGYYGPEHVARLKLVREMQARGFNLTAIKHLLAASAGAGEEILGFTRTLMRPFERERPELVEAGELATRLGGSLQPKVLRRAEELGLVRPLAEGTYEVPSPTLLRAGEEVVRLGIPLEAALDVIEQVGRHSEGVTRAFVALFLERIWKPFAEAGYPDNDWPRVREAVERLRPLATETLVAVFEPRLTSAVETAFGKELERREGREA